MANNTNRFTPTSKWEMPWFCDLSKNAQHLALFIADKCDCAGFWEDNPRLAQFSTKLTKEEYEEAYGELTADPENGHFISHGGKTHFKDFLDWQCAKPLKVAQKYHKTIIKTEQKQFDETFYNCKAYKRPMIEDAQGKKVPIGAPAVAPVAVEEPMTVTIAEVAIIEPEVNHGIHELAHREVTPTRCITMLSRAELQNIPKDWNRIRQLCLTSMQPGFKFDALGRAMSEWWDHCFAMGKPYELPMWRKELTRMEDAVRRYKNTDVIVEAISYSISARNVSLNYDMTAKAMSSSLNQAGVSTLVGAQAPAEPKGWQEMLTAMYPDAKQKFVRYCDVPKPAREKIEQRLTAQ